MTRFDLNVSKTKVNEKLELNKIRVHYFFTENTLISQFLNDIEIKFRITFGSSWNTNVYAEGFTSPFQYLNKSDFSRVQVQSFSSYLFSDKLAKFSLMGTVGLKKDQQI